MEREREWRGEGVKQNEMFLGEMRFMTSSPSVKKRRREKGVNFKWYQ
jgi:hypothetical protein